MGKWNASQKLPIFEHAAARPCTKTPTLGSGYPENRSLNPKKQMKKVIHVMWKARMGADLKSRRLIFVALLVSNCIISTYCLRIKVSKLPNNLRINT